MKKTGFRLLLVLFALVLGFVSVPFFQGSRAFSSAEESPKPEFSLVPANYNVDSDLTYQKYNILNENLNSFTPFDYESENRMLGQSFKFKTTASTDEKNHGFIDNEYVLVDRHEDIIFSESLALSLWIYFDSNILSDLKITLDLEDGGKIEFMLYEYDLKNLVSKTENEEDSTPYAYNKFVIPLSIGNSSANIVKDSKLLPIEKMRVSFGNADLSGDISKLLFYDVKIVAIDNADSIKVEKQNYSIGSFYFYEANLMDKLYLGDYITIPSESKAIKYAYQGTRDLTSKNAANANITWRVFIIDPDGENSNANFGDKLTFTKQGAYKIYYRCFDIVNGNSQVILGGMCTINIRKLNALYFSKPSLRAEVGTSYVLGITISSAFTSHSDISFEYDRSAISVEWEDSNTIVVTALKKGTHTLKAKFSGDRVGFNSDREYESSLKVESVSVKNKGDSLRIFIYVALGLVGVTILVSLFVLLVKKSKKSIK